MVYLDARGRSNAGDLNRLAGYLKMGEVESKDVTEFANFLKNGHENKDRFGKFMIWGWSYGAFVVSHAAGLQDDVWSCAIAVQSISSADSFDTIFIEKLMRDKSLNQEGYDKSVVMSNLDRKQFFTKYSLIMGTSDNAHHFNNAALISKRVVDSGFEFNNYFISNGQSLRKHYISHRWMHGVMDEMDKGHSEEDFLESADLIGKRVYKLLLRQIMDCQRGEL